MTCQVHATAIVDAKACLGEGVSVGPFAVIGSGVSVGARTVVGAHAIVEGRACVGQRCTIASHAVVGGRAQIRHAIEQGKLSIANGCYIGEFVTIHCGGPGGVTSVGVDNYFMAYCHVAHDCRIGDGNEIANGVQLGGHVQMGNNVTVGGMAAVHQYVSIGDHAMLAAGSIVTQDVLPYCQVGGDRARLYGLNVVGLRRHGFSAQSRREIDQVVRTLYDAPTLTQGLERLAAMSTTSSWTEKVAIFARQSRRGLCRGVRGLSAL